MTGNILPSDPDPGAAEGAGIFNMGTMFIDHSTIANNDNERGNGGGIRNQAMLFLNDSTLFGNTALGDGGGIQNDGSATPSLDCTITSNTASRNSVYDNDAGGGGVSNYTGFIAAATLENTIIAGNHSPTHSRHHCNVSRIRPTFYSVLATILIGDVAVDSEIRKRLVAGDQIGHPPIPPFDPPYSQHSLTMADSTQTCALLAGSPAVDVGEPAAPPSDQRDYYRQERA